jgi:hypothetical protein
MSQSTPQGSRQANIQAADEAEVRDALLDHSDETYNAWIFAQLDAAEARAYREQP